jgi:hypothetical protein
MRMEESTTEKVTFGIEHPIRQRDWWGKGTGKDV